MKFCKQTVGVDISKGAFDAHFLALPLKSDRLKVRGSRKFSNSPKGILAFQSWVNKKKEIGTPLIIAMEATGVYHENLAYFLSEKEFHVTVLLPNRVKAFARSYNQYSKTDEIDARVIALMAIERSLKPWTPANKSLRQLRNLTRERQGLKQDRRRHTNQLHALAHRYDKCPRTKRRHEVSINLIDRQLKAIDREIVELQKQDEQLDVQMSRLQTIPQVGPTTAASILAETGGFQLFESRQQLVKYAGMDIIERQSGSSVRGRSRLSKKGNSNLRAALHMPAIGLINRDTPFRDIYLRVLERTSCKMKAIVAVQRKLLVVMYAVFSNEQDYSVEAHRKRSKNKKGEPKRPACSDSVGLSQSVLALQR